MILFRALAVAALLAPAALRAQGVLVAPTGVFMDHRTRGASIEVYNPGNEAVEVAVSMLFGYPVSDSLGRVTLQTISEPDPSAPSAAKWVEAFPRRLLLRPSERQTVRLLARPPAALPDGEYWTRVVIASKGTGAPRDAQSDSSGVRVGLMLEVRTIIALLYRKGTVKTGLEATNLRARVVGDSLQLCARFTRQGNAAFLGTVHGTLVDAAGRHVASLAAPLAVYHTMAPCYSTPVRDLPSGRYVARMVVDTDRDDVRRDALLPIAAVRDSAVVEVVRQAP